MLGDITKSANTLNYIKEILYPIKNGEFNAMKEALQTSRNLSMSDVLSSTSEEVIIDGSGYTGRRLLDTGAYDPKQVKITGRNLVFTDDAWETCKVAIGELLFGDGSSAYGINAEAIVGDIIIGNNIHIIDKNGDDMFKVVDDKITATVQNIDGKLTQIEQTSDALNIRIESLENAEQRMHQDIKEIKQNLKITYQKTGLVKYDAFREMSGALSYSLALLDKQNNGVLITSMYSREGCYTYAKDIVNGESEINLSEEEREALKQAVAK